MQVYFLSQANESLQFQQITSWVRQPKRTWSSFRDFLLLRPEFFTACCKIGWDWINLERCYSRKLNIAARMIGYLWSIKSIIFSSENVSRNKTFLKIISMNQDMFKSLQKILWVRYSYCSFWEAHQLSSIIIIMDAMILINPN